MTDIHATPEDFPIVLRPLVDEDKPFIYSSWQRSYQDCEYAAAPNPAIYMRVQTAVIDRCLASSECLVAACPDDQSQIFGWISYSRQPDQIGFYAVVNYVFVKETFRRHGVATRLLLAAIDGANDIYTTHNRRRRTGPVTYSPGKALCDAVGITARYNPYMILL